MLITWGSEAILLGDDIHFHEAFVISLLNLFVSLALKAPPSCFISPTWEARLKKKSKDEKYTTKGLDAKRLQTGIPNNLCQEKNYMHRTIKTRKACSKEDHSV